MLLLFSELLFAQSRPDRVTGREERILEIQRLIEKHDLEGARRSLNDASKEFAQDPGFDNLLGVVEAQQGHYREAENCFNRAILRGPTLTAAYLNLGRLYQENTAADPKALNKALAIYRRVLQYRPDDPEANYQSAVLLLQRGEYQDSLARISRLPRDLQGRAQTLSILCADYAALGNRERTNDAAHRLMADPDFSEADIKQMLAGVEAGKREDLAVSLLEKLKQRQALSLPLLHTLGLLYERTGRLTEARAVLEEFVAAGNLSLPSLFELARIAHEQQDYQGSLGYLAHARDLEPNNAQVHYSFGLVCLDLNLIAEARNSFEKAVKLEPENASFNYAMGATSAYRHDPAEAVPYFEKYLKLNPRDPRGKLALAVALFRAKDYANAVPWLKQAAKIGETATPAHYYLGSIALEEHRLDEAFSELGEALKAKPDYADALAELGQYYLVRRDYVEAEKRLRRALDLDPDHIPANFYLLTVYTRTRDPRREAQAKRFHELEKLRDEKTQEFLRMVEVRPFTTP
jgi:tetratricopeptide (TPR) repeat protein